FGVLINGQIVLTGFDVVQAAAGPNRAVAQTFTAIADASGTIAIRFIADRDNAEVNGIAVIPPPMTAVDAGGSAAGGYQADTGAGFSGQSQAAPLTSSVIDTSQVANPAPQAVYQSYRYGPDFTYTATGLVPGGIYAVRLDFAEVYWSQPGQRV